MRLVRLVQSALFACVLLLPIGCGKGKDSAGCPEGSSGEGSTAKPCTPSDKSARLLKATLLGDVKGPLRFKFHNLSDKKIQLFTLKMWFYDAEGKLLTLQQRLVGERDYWMTNVDLPAGLAPKGEVEQALGPTPDKIPQGTANVEVEVLSAAWDCAPQKGCGGNWANNELAPPKRKQSGR